MKAEAGSYLFRKLGMFGFVTGLQTFMPKNFKEVVSSAPRIIALANTPNSGKEMGLQGHTSPFAWQSAADCNFRPFSLVGITMERATYIHIRTALEKLVQSRPALFQTKTFD